MQNYRNKGMAYTTYRQTPVCVVEKERNDVFYGMPLAMAYVPWQKWQNIYDAEKGFCRGTIFQELDLPFFGVGGCQDGK